MLAPVVVNTTVDERDGIADGQISLRDAIDVAGTLGFDPIINFDSSVPGINGGTIVLDDALGEIAFGKSLTIDASMLPDGITIAAPDTNPGTTGSGGIRIFNIDDPTNGADPPDVTMIGLTLTGADPSSGSQGAKVGGAIRSEGFLTLQDTEIIDNEATLGGGVYLAVAGSGSTQRTVLSVQNSRLQDNSAIFGGGAILVQFRSSGQDKVELNESIIIGDGPGLSIINGSTSSSGRILDVANLGVLTISRVTLEVGHGTSTSDQRNGGAIRVQNGGQLHMDYSAVVGNETGGWGLGGGIYFASTASGSIKSSVITVNYADQQTGGLYLQAATAGTGGTVTIQSTIVAKNSDGEGSLYPDIYVGDNRTLTSLGNNRFTSASGFTMLTTDYMGTVDYVVISVADTYDGSASPLNMSLRDAIHQANITVGDQKIWLPAWEFILTRERLADDALNVAYGDLEITDSLTIRGISGSTSVAWGAGTAVDEVFELLGDYNHDGVVDPADDVVWRKAQQEGTASGDGDDDGDTDQDDYNIWYENYGHTLVLDGVIVS